ncbi:MAG: glycosyltransferase [Bdellovibrionaceae bacterium]|nr:glycosyltransferase [Pseudobdellovibrionaceae bacterium]
MEISVVILNKDKPELIGNCLTSLFEKTQNLNFEVLVGDTGSAPSLFTSVYQKFQSQYPQNFKYIEAGEYNFSRNNNVVAKHATGKLILFLNNDTQLLHNSLPAMVDLMESDTSIGCLGPKLVFGFNRKIQHAGIEFFKHPIFGVLGYHPYSGKHETLRDVNFRKMVPAVTGACLLVRKTDFDCVGGFDEGYLSEAQDVDLCFKISQLGKKVVYDGQTTIVHLENGSRPLGEENRSDRKLLIKKWGRKIKSEFLNSRFQFQYYSQDENIAFQQSKKILFERIKARGDVLASLRLCKLIKASEPRTHISFTTEFPDLVDSSPYVDRVLALGEVDTWTYDRVLKPTYEDGKWKESSLKWIEQMAKSIGLSGHIPDEPMSLNFSSYDNVVVDANMLGIPDKYVVIGTGAGWTEREWTPAEWDKLCHQIRLIGCAVVQIGGETDYQVPGAIIRLNRTLQTNYQILKKSRGAILLDSFPLHVAMMTDCPVIILTCKTCHATVWYRSSVKEIRNFWAVKTPKPQCREEGCRLRYGNGLDNPCSTPILKDLDYKPVFDMVLGHFGLSGEHHATK